MWLQLHKGWTEAGRAVAKMAVGWRLHLLSLRTSPWGYLSVPDSRILPEWVIQDREVEATVVLLISSQKPPTVTSAIFHPLQVNHWGQCRESGPTFWKGEKCIKKMVGSFKNYQMNDAAEIPYCLRTVFSGRGGVHDGEPTTGLLCYYRNSHKVCASHFSGCWGAHGDELDMDPGNYGTEGV